MLLSKTKICGFILLKLYTLHSMVYPIGWCPAVHLTTFGIMLKLLNLWLWDFMTG